MTKSNRPRILEPGEAKCINREALRKTGCFFFLNTDDLPHPEPSSLQDAFLTNIVSLYALYHDYGRKFLLLCLRNDLLPSSADARMQQRAKNAFSHIQTVCRYFRASFCHGTYWHDGRSRTELIRQIGLYSNKSISQSGDWPGPLFQVSSAEWEIVSQRIIQEADELYDFLVEWTQLWHKAEPAERKLLKQLYLDIGDDGHRKNWTGKVSDNKNQPIFLRSFDKGLCLPIIRNLRQGATRQLPKEDTIYCNGVGGVGGIAQWAGQLRKDILNNHFDDPVDIYHALFRMIKSTIQGPVGRSSMAIAKQTGFDV